MQPAYQQSVYLISVLQLLELERLHKILRALPSLLPQYSWGKMLKNNYYSTFINVLHYNCLILLLLRMQDKTLRRHFDDLADLSPWRNEQRLENSRTIDIEIKPKKLRKMKSIPPRVKLPTQRKISERNTVKVVDYELPPVNRRILKEKQQYSLTIDPPQGKLIRNMSSHRLQSSQSMSKIVPQIESYRFRLSGKKYDMIPQERNEKWRMMEPKHNIYQDNNTMFLFTKKKDQILKRVLNQIQGRIRQLGIYQ